MNNRKISLCLTNYNRVELLFQSFGQVLDDDRISEIVISDDYSEIELYEQVKGIISALNPLHNNKIKLYRNEVNLDCYKNKRQAISLASNDWCIIFDSDNILNKQYIGRLYQINKWNKETVYCPTWAQPTFDYRAFEGLLIDKYNVAVYADAPMFLTALNTMNCFVNKNSFLSIWVENIEPVTCDSIFVNYNWLLNGFKILFVDNLYYQHLIHSGSHYRLNVSRTPNGMAEEIEQKIKSLK